MCSEVIWGHLSDLVLKNVNKYLQAHTHQKEYSDTVENMVGILKLLENRKRKSNQSTGYMIELHTGICNHKYNRSSMKITLFPLVQSIVNQLKYENLISNYTSGENLMTLYKTVLKLRHSKDLCEQTVIKQSSTLSILTMTLEWI